MALDRKNGDYVFDDQPEQAKLKRWYDQVRNAATDSWTKRDASTGRFMDGKADGKPFKGVIKEK